MKKRTLKSIVCAAVMTLALSITACGGSGDMTLEKYYNENKEELDAAWGSMGEAGMDVDIDVVDNELILNITLTDSTYLVDGIGELLDEAIQSEADTFKSQVAEFDKEIGKDGACKATIRYLDPDGNVLSENSFTAK